MLKRKTFKYRFYPNKRTIRRLHDVMRNAVTPVWNACVAEHEKARELFAKKLDKAFNDFVQEHKRDMTKKEEKYIRRKVSRTINWPTKFSQYKHVRKREHPEYEDYPAKMMQCTMIEVNNAMKSYLALKKKGDEQARPPRQQDMHRCVTFHQSGWKPEDYKGGRLYLTGIGSGRVRLHRPIEGVIKMVSIIEKNRKWDVCFSVEY